jgi:hypothetical protein
VSYDEGDGPVSGFDELDGVPRINDVLADILGALDGDDSPAATAARTAIAKALDGLRSESTEVCHRLVDAALAAIDAMELP